MTPQIDSSTKNPARRGGLLLALALLASLSAEANTQPNVVLILADDIGYSDFGAYGS